jgi:hypothetical protein
MHSRKENLNRRGFMRHVAQGAIAITVGGNVLMQEVEGATVGVDGAGVARIVSPDILVAGSKTPVSIEVTVGSGGIPVGGAVSFGLHHASGWRGLQTTAPNRPGYISVACGTPKNLDLKWYGWIPKGKIEKVVQFGNSDYMCHQCAVATVRNKPLQAGEVVTFVIGGNEHGAPVQTQVDPKHPFHIMTDGDGDGVLKGIAQSPHLDIVSGPAHHLVASMPATLVLGEGYSLQIRAEDAHCNLAADYAGAVTVRDEDGKVVADNVVVRNGLTRIPLRVEGTPGPQRFRVTDGTLEGVGTPCRVFETAPATRIWWGDIHGHTNISDGLGETSDEFFAFGRDMADLDVCALTDHGHFDWPQTVASVKKFHEPGRYVTILAQESGAGADHYNFYFRDDDAAHIAGWPKKVDEVFQMLEEQYNAKTPGSAMTGPHHFTYHRGDARYPFGLFDTRSARFVEVYSSHGTSEFLGNPRPVSGAEDEDKFMQAGLAKGLRFGVIGSSDGHDSHPGRTRWGHYPGGLVAFQAPSLTREAIWDAWWNYRVYATSFDRIYVDFQIDGHGMGSEVRANGACKIRYDVIGYPGEIEVTLVRNNEDYRVITDASGIAHGEIEDRPPSGGSFYYLRVVQANGERAWSTPIWVQA